MIPSLIKVFFPAVLSFFIGIAVTPALTHYLYKYKMWKRSPRERDDLPDTVEISQEFKDIHNTGAETSTPRIGGVVIWGSVLITTFIIFILSLLIPTSGTEKLNFLSRNQTILPFLGLIVGSLIGLIDDMLSIHAIKGLFVNGFPRRWMFVIVSAIGLIGGWWFFAKLGVSAISIPFADIMFEVGVFMIPLFWFVVLATFSTGVIDGIDGLAAGVMATVFAAFAVIAYFQNQIDIAAFSAAISGGILAFLWFNIPPARFYMGETGMLGLTVALAVIAFLTDQVLVLPIIAFPLVLTSLSSAIQITTKKIWGPKGKVFRVAPLHHHFEAIGWSREKITMRYWVISVIFAVIGVIIALLSW